MGTMNKILQLLNEKGLNQKDLTDFLNIDKSTFTAWKNGKSKSYNKYMSDIAEYFGVSTDYLLGRTDDPVDYENSLEFLNAPLDVINHFGGDAKKVCDFQKAVEIDALSEAGRKYEKLVLLNRNAQKLSEENLDKLMNVAKAMFEEEFND